MSELRIALVAEGPTDWEVIHAALKAVLPTPFVMTLLQPEATPGITGTGWCGVLKWCHTAQEWCNGSLDTAPTLVDFDLLIIHLDVDVSSFEYGMCGAWVEELAQANHWGILPCDRPCPPVSNTVDALVDVLKTWLGKTTSGDRTVFCLPAQSSGTWLAAAVLPPGHPLLAGGECDRSIEDRLASLPKAQRIRKTRRAYQDKAPYLTQHWEQVKQICSQATAFEKAVLTAIHSLGNGIV